MACYKKQMSKILKFLVTGGIATITHYVIFWLCLAVVEIDSTISSAIGYMFGSVVSYFLNYYFTFDSRRSHKKAILFFYLMVMIGLFINIASMHTLVKELELKPWLAQIYVTGITLIFNFIISKKFVFGWRRL
jgi:putative flippase GtrA